MGWPIVLAVAGIAKGLYDASSASSSATKQAMAMREQLNFQNKIIGINQKVTDFQFRDALRRGGEEMVANTARANKILGSQTAALAAQGVDVSSGAAAQIQEETQILSAQDNIRIKNNAWREAFGYKVEGLNASLQGRINTRTTGNTIRNTLATGGIQAISHGAGGLLQGAGTLYNAYKK